MSARTLWLPWAALLSLTVLAGSGCKKSSDDAASFLKSSMDHYKGLASYAANWDWTLTQASSKTLQHRSLEYSKPNAFKYEMSMSVPGAKSGETWTVDAISNGGDLVETSSRKQDPPIVSRTPDSIAGSHSSQVMGRLNLGLSPLYLFFAGSSGYGNLVDESKGAPTFGPEEQVLGEPAKHVLFYAAGDSFGQTNVLIGEQSLNVYKISYDLAPAVAKMPKLKGVSVLENFTAVNDRPVFGAEEFAVSPPKAAQVIDADTTNKPWPPAGFGRPAPDMTVKDVKSGKLVKLSSLRGKPVLLDFWATWCGPCRETLPHTEDVYRQYGKSDLQVLTISDESQEKIQNYIAQNGYTFPTYQDNSLDAFRLYHAKSIPLLVIIDKDGNMSSYIQGGVSEDVLKNALKKVSIG